MINLNNEKNKSSVILNPERSEWVSRSHVTSVESVVNDGAKTQCYSAKRDLYGPSLRSTIKMTVIALIFTLATTTESSAKTWDCGEDENTVSCSLENGVFTISGTGKMKDCQYDNRPWDSENIQTVVVDKGVTSIGNYAFLNADSLKSIKIPKGVTSIGNGAFWGASSLESITIPDSVKGIGNFAFSDASSLTSITIPKGVTYIGYNAFQNASSLTSITIPEGVTSIGNYTFAGASSLESITIPKGVTSIGYAAFQYASSLKSITIPEGVTSIPSAAFAHASSLTSITIPDSVTEIGQAAFSDASSLTSITIPDSVTSIGMAAFANTGLTSITIPDSVTSIGTWAFMDAESLASITIPDNINTKNWGDQVFEERSRNFKNIFCQGDLNKCYEQLAKYFSADDPRCPANVTCNCYGSKCIDSGLVKEATQEQCGGKYIWDETSNPKCRHMDYDECENSAKYYINNGQCKSMPGSKTKCKNADFLWSENSCVKSCASGFVEWDNECLSEYPFAKKRWTPAEANEWLHDGNDNFVVITFKK